MIRIYGISADSLPAEEMMQARIGEQWTAAWKERHPSLTGSAARLSLGGLYLLRESGAEGELSYTEMGRPFLKGQGIDFSISHTRDAVFCAVGDGSCTVGLDAEDLSRLSVNKPDAMAARWFCEAERVQFERNPTPNTFLSIWTRKEAFVKRTGEGMRKLRLADTFAPCGEDKTAFWTFWTNDVCVTLCADEGVEAQDLIFLTAKGNKKKNLKIFSKRS